MTVYQNMNNENEDTKRYWLYSPGKQAVKWKEFYNGGIMAIGWDKLGDLEIYTDRKSILEALIDNYGGGEDQRNNVSAIDDFCNGENKINIGDIVIAKKGKNTLLGYGKVISDYYYDENREEFLHCREVEWFKKGEWDVDDDLPRKTLTDTTLEKARYLLNIMNENTNKQENNHMIELLKYKPQIILQGPPSTGKTREAKRIAKALLGLGENDSLEGNERFKLIQFHPSYSYEDFVRGIVAKPNEEGDGILYSAENKVLAKFAKEALENYLYSDGNIKSWINNNFDRFKREIQNIIEKESKYILDEKTAITNIKEEEFILNNTSSTIDINFLKKLIEKVIEENFEITAKNTRNLLGIEIRYSNYKLLIERFLEKYIFHKSKLKNYVLIIDEINRANLSAVLGELIYALEYRGEAVQSMYAIEGENNLILPPNLYIIGTMNTADRSVGHIDYAIRRRFAFVNILPKDLTDELGDQFESELFAKVINLFNTNLSSEFKKEEVQLGHSYFITKNTPIGIRWEYEIKPILLEYVKDGILVGEGIETTINNLINDENNAS